MKKSRLTRAWVAKAIKKQLTSADNTREIWSTVADCKAKLWATAEVYGAEHACEMIWHELTGADLTMTNGMNRKFK